MPEPGGTGTAPSGDQSAAASPSPSQSTTTSTDTTTAAPAAQTAVSTAAQPEPAASRGWNPFASLFARRAEPETDDSTDEPASQRAEGEPPKGEDGKPTDGAAASAGKANAGSPRTGTGTQDRLSPEEIAKTLDDLSDEELSQVQAKSPKVQRLVQSETDRRAARAAKEAKQQRLAELEASEREVRATDPYQAAELRDAIDAEKSAEEAEAVRESAAKEQSQLLSGLLNSAVRDYDAATLDVLIEAVPEADRAAILDGAPRGLDGRTQLVTGVLAYIRKTEREAGAQAADKKLRASESFRKQVLLGERDEEDEPMLVPSGASRSAAPDDMNSLIRAAAGHARSARGNPLHSVENE